MPLPHCTQSLILLWHLYGSFILPTTASVQYLRWISRWSVTLSSWFILHISPWCFTRHYPSGYPLCFGLVIKTVIKFWLTMSKLVFYVVLSKCIVSLSEFDSCFRDAYTFLIWSFYYCLKMVMQYVCPLCNVRHNSRGLYIKGCHLL